MGIRISERPMVMERRMSQAACLQMSIEEMLRKKIGDPLRPIEVEYLMDMVRKYARLCVEAGGGEIL